MSPRPAPPPTRRDGAAPIGSYGVLGDGRTVALVAADGRVDWWPLPTMDSPPAFAALVDPPRGGHLALAPRGPFEVSRRYLPGTNVLETTFHTASGSVRLTDALAVGRSGRLPWTELIRRVEGVEGEVDLAWSVVPGTRFGTARPWVQERPEAAVVHVGDQLLAVRAIGLGAPRVRPDRVDGLARTSPSSCGWLAVASSDREPVFVPDRTTLADHLDLTMTRWRDWSGSIRYGGRWDEAVRRSALALKLLLYTPTGAIAAAPTTSLPERIGGRRNWDYRYMWVRDSSFTVDALIALGLHEEVQAAVSWLLDSVGRTAPDVHVFYRLDGGIAEEEDELDAAGYRGSRPVRAGNRAGGQTQLGTFGDLFDTVVRYVDEGHVLDPGTERLLADLADRCCDVWMREDAGLWELPERRHYTISKIGCWVALDRASLLHERGLLPSGHAGRWAHERDAVRAFVLEHCWSERGHSFTFAAGSEDLDAATLLAGPSGFDRGERLAGTVEAVRRELAEGPLVYRYTGMREEEGAFAACSFWLAHALAVLGRLEEASEVMDGAIGHANDLGLLSEEIDPSNGELLGNFPQGLSHLALVNAAMACSRASAR